MSTTTQHGAAAVDAEATVAGVTAVASTEPARTGVAAAGATQTGTAGTGGGGLTRRAVLVGAGMLAGTGVLVACGAPAEQGGPTTSAPTTGGAATTDPATADPATEEPTDAATTEAPAADALASLGDIPVGGALAASLDGAPIVLTQATAGVVVGLSAICTHQGCEVQPDGERLLCPCHGSTFALDGSVIAGLAREPLPAVAVHVSGDDVLAGAG